MNAERALLARRTGLASLTVGGLTVLMAKSMEQPVMRTGPRWLTEGEYARREASWSRDQAQARWFMRIGWILAGGGVALVGLSYALEDRGLAALAEKPAGTGAVEGAGNKWLPWTIGAIALGGLGMTWVLFRYNEGDKEEIFSVQDEYVHHGEPRADIKDRFTGVVLRGVPRTKFKAITDEEAHAHILEEELRQVAARRARGEPRYSVHSGGRHNEILFRTDSLEEAKSYAKKHSRYDGGVYDNFATGYGWV